MDILTSFCLYLSVQAQKVGKDNSIQSFCTLSERWLSVCALWMCAHWKLLTVCENPNEFSL